MTKRCPRCQTVKPWSDFYPRTRWQDGTTRTVRPECKACSVRLHVETRRTVESYRRRHAAHQEEYRQRRCSTPEGLGLERARKRDHMRRKNGTTPDRYRTGVGHSHATRHDAIDATPFRDWLLTIRPEYESIVHMATALGVNDSTLAKVIAGTKATVAFSTVDRALCGYGRPDLLDTLYPTQKVA